MPRVLRVKRHQCKAGPYHERLHERAVGPISDLQASVGAIAQAGLTESNCMNEQLDHFCPAPRLREQSG